VHHFIEVAICALRVKRRAAAKKEEKRRKDNNTPMQMGENLCVNNKRL